MKKLMKTNVICLPFDTLSSAVSSEAGDGLITHERHRTYNGTLRRVRETIVAVENH